MMQYSQALNLADLNYTAASQAQNAAALESRSWANQVSLIQSDLIPPVSYTIRYHARMMIAEDIGLGGLDPLSYWLGGEAA